METVDDIIKEIRFAANMPNCVDRNEALNLADRLDAAYRRDTKAVVDANEIAMRTAMGEVAKLRAALYSDGDFGRSLKERDIEIERLKAVLKDVIQWGCSKCVYWNSRTESCPRGSGACTHVRNWKDLLGGGAK